MRFAACGGADFECTPKEKGRQAEEPGAPEVCGIQRQQRDDVRASERGGKQSIQHSFSAQRVLRHGREKPGDSRFIRPDTLHVGSVTPGLPAFRRTIPRACPVGSASGPSRVAASPRRCGHCPWPSSTGRSGRTVRVPPVRPSRIDAPRLPLQRVYSCLAKVTSVPASGKPGCQPE